MKLTAQYDNALQSFSEAVRLKDRTKIVEAHDAVRIIGGRGMHALFVACRARDISLQRFESVDVMTALKILGL